MSNSISYDGARCWHPSILLNKHSTHNASEGPITCLACVVRSF